MYVQFVRFAAKAQYTPPCSRAVFTGREHGCNFGHPWTRAVKTGSYWQWRHNCMYFLLENVWDNTGYQHGPWTRVMCTEPKRNSQINCYTSTVGWRGWLRTICELYIWMPHAESVATIFVCWVKCYIFTRPGKRRQAHSLRTPYLSSYSSYSNNLASLAYDISQLIRPSKLTYSLYDSKHRSMHMMKSHTHTVVRECCKGDDQSQWRRANFDPRHP